MDGNKTATVSDEGDGTGLVEKVKFVFKPFHLALIAKRDRIVSLMLNKALSQEDHELREAQLDLLIGSKTTLKALGNNYIVYDKVDLMLDGMTSLHVASRYNPCSLKYIVQQLNRDSWEDYAIVKAGLYFGFAKKYNSLIKGQVMKKGSILMIRKCSLELVVHFTGNYEK